MTHLKFREIPGPLEKRVKIARANKFKLEPNCYGTAFFLLGVLPYDRVVFYNYVGKIPEFMDQLDKPEDNSIIMPFKGNLNFGHAVYIEKGSSVEGYQRVGLFADFEIVKNMEDVQDYLDGITNFQFFCKNSKWKYKYYGLPTSKIKKKKLDKWARDVVSEYSPQWWEPMR